ncbi:hypothetical protein RJT34_18598 [Clitoria ternatea]|uniref:Tify domain-containing protein n=1 Tax=Clitoria ternatea TaxID=43366 RepID=A0AAN9JBV9_CLITE
MPTYWPNLSPHSTWHITKLLRSHLSSITPTHSRNRLAFYTVQIPPIIIASRMGHVYGEHEHGQMAPLSTAERLHRENSPAIVPVRCPEPSPFAGHIADSIARFHILILGFLIEFGYFDFVVASVYQVKGGDSHYPLGGDTVNRRGAKCSMKLHFNSGVLGMKNFSDHFVALVLYWVVVHGLTFSTEAAISGRMGVVALQRGYRGENQALFGKQYKNHVRNYTYSLLQYFIASFQHKIFWMSRDNSCLAEENVGYENSSRIEPKRSNQWFTDTGEPEVFNKKQAVEADSGRPVSGVSHVNIPQWDTNSGFHSITGQFSDRLFGSDLVRTVNMVDKNMPSIGNGNLNMGRKDFENQYGNDPSVGLSISHSVADPSSCLNFGGIRKVKVNQVRDSENCMPAASMGNSYSRVDNSTISVGSGYSKNDGNISLAYNNGNDNTIAMGTRISKADDSVLSMAHTFNKGDGSFMLMGHNYGKGDESILSMGQPFDRGDGNFISVGQSFEKEDGNLISLGTSYSKGHDSFISMGPNYGKSGEHFMNVAPYDKGTDHIMSMGPTYDKADSNIASTVPSYDRGDSSSLPVDQSHHKGQRSTISFGGFNDDPEPNPSGGIISGYDLLMGSHNSPQGLDSQKDLTELNSESIVNSIPKPNTKNNSIVKNKEPKTTKKSPTNNFPSNVKSLLSTGIFDGVAVKYVSWSREKTLDGIIKGTGYLCSCVDCKQSKALNAYEFERHAGAKTKHPNNHIYFENGKTIYAVVQELKNTPQEMLFDAIQSVTGSNINQKNFRTWKASYQAATRELQRIYGKDEVVIPS